MKSGLMLAVILTCKHCLRTRRHKASTTPDWTAPGVAMTTSLMSLIRLHFVVCGDGYISLIWVCLWLQSVQLGLFCILWFHTVTCDLLYEDSLILIVQFSMTTSLMSPIRLQLVQMVI